MPTQKQYLDNEGLTELLDELGQHLKSKLDKTNHLVIDEDPTGGSLTIQNAEILNKIESITATESTASGGANTVTITETNGTSTSFNVLNGINGGNLGDVDIVDVTGDRTDAVMSQKSVTEYGRKVTAEDLAGTSDWVKARLTEEGWAFGKYVNIYGNTVNGANFCASRFIEIGDIADHSITVSYMFNGNNTYCVCFYNDNNERVNYWSCNGNNSRSFTPTATQIAGATKIRCTFNSNNLNNCYVYDNTANEYIFKVSEDIETACLDSNLTSRSLAQELGKSKAIAVSQNVVNGIQKNIDAIGRRSFSTTSAFNANYQGGATLCHSLKKYNTSSLPWVDVVSYNVVCGTSASNLFFGFCPYNVTDPRTSKDYIGFTNNVWNANFIIRRNGTTVFTQTNAIQSINSTYVVGFRLDFRRKTILLMKRTTAGVLWSDTIDLSDYDLDLGMCYLYTTFGYCSYVADQYIGWNSLTNMTDFSAFFNTPIIVGNFKKFTEHPYPSDDIDGSVFRTLTNLMNNLSSTQDENGHWVASINLSSPTSVGLQEPSIPTTHYLYTNYDMMFYIGKIKVTDGSLQLTKQYYSTIKDVYDLTSDTFLIDDNGVYTIAENHTVEVRVRIGINSRNKPFNFNGTCTVEMWDWEVHVAMNENLTPTNYDGTKIFGGIPFEFTKPNLVTDFPLVSSADYNAQGLMKYASNKLYARVYDTSTNTFVDKQISNT